jgi:AraC-like DNA-binding protein
MFPVSCCRQIGHVHGPGPARPRGNSCRTGADSKSRYVNRRDHAGIPERMLSPAGSTGPPGRFSFSGRPDSARDQLPDSAGTVRSALVRSRNSRRSKPPDGKSDCLGHGELWQAFAGELAQLASTGVSTLHHHFRMLTSMNPLQYKKQLRLQVARSLMLNSGVDAASTALEVGYESPTQFNREYSCFFGQPPMRDIRVSALPASRQRNRSAIKPAPDFLIEKHDLAANLKC